MQYDMGQAKKLLLKKESIPCVYPEGTCHSQASGGRGAPAVKPSPAMRKREAIQVFTYLYSFLYLM